MLDIECHDVMRAGFTRCGEHMNVIWIGERQASKGCLVEVQSGVWKGFIHEPNSPGHALTRALACLDDSSGHFAQNLIAPNGSYSPIAGVARRNKESRRT